MAEWSRKCVLVKEGVNKGRSLIGCLSLAWRVKIKLRDWLVCFSKTCLIRL